MELTFRHIDEKDIDLLIMDRVASDANSAGGGGLLDLLVGEVADEFPGGPEGYALARAQHSVATESGESDLVFVLDGPGGKHAILVEDKIDAPPQHEQAKRYERRGREGISTGDWSTYSVILVAPEQYLEAAREPYPHKLSYQRIREALAPGDLFGRRMISEAIAKQEAGWQPNVSEVMTAFYDTVAKTAGRMDIKPRCMHKEGDKRAERTAWVDFESPLAGTRISWKSEQGRVMLAFSGWGGNVDALKALVGALPPDAYWRKPAKGIKTAYLCIDALDKVVDWREATEDAPLIEDALDKVQRLYDFALGLNNRVIDWDGER